MTTPLDIVVLGLSITSSWGNGHATTWRGLVRGLAERGHSVLFLERDVPWYASNRDLPEPPFGRTVLYRNLEELRDRFTPAVRRADAVIVGSYVPDGVAVGDWVLREARGVRAFYDIDTPVTLAQLESGEAEYLAARQIPQWDLYLSFAGGRSLSVLEQRWGARRAAPLYCGVDTAVHRPRTQPGRWDLGYLGTWSADRQPKLESLLLAPARARPERRFAVAGPQYPASVRWPGNVERIDHVAPAEHADFYAAQRFTLNLTRADMTRAGCSPSVRLFEAAACGTAIVSDAWPGIERFFQPGQEILLVRNAGDVLHLLDHMGEEERRALAGRARERVLSAHTATHRAAELERLCLGAVPRPASAARLSVGS